MEASSLPIAGLKLLTPARLADERGFFSETFNARTMACAGVAAEFVQDNHSYSKSRGTVRGLHFQIPPRAQGKLVRVVRGAILDVAVDIRHGSPTYGRHAAVVLSAANWAQLWAPPGFAHGFWTLEPDTEVLYKVTDFHDPACERGVRFDDPDLMIPWPGPVDAAVLADKDRWLGALRDEPPWFLYSGLDHRSSNGAASRSPGGEGSL